MPKGGDSRHFARWIALQYLFNASFEKEERGVFDFDTLQEINEVEDFKVQLAQSLIDGVSQNREKLDNLIIQLAPERPLEEIAKVDLNILRIAVFEGFLAKTTPEKVAIDEAIELAKEFGGEHSSNFVNGVLDNLLKNKDNYIL